MWTLEVRQFPFCHVFGHSLTFPTLSLTRIWLFFSFLTRAFPRLLIRGKEAIPWNREACTSWESRFWFFQLRCLCVCAIQHEHRHSLRFWSPEFCFRSLWKTLNETVIFFLGDRKMGLLRTGRASTFAQFHRGLLIFLTKQCYFGACSFFSFFFVIYWGQVFFCLA